MNANDIHVTIKSQSGGTWPDAVFNVHQHIRHLLDEAVSHFHLDPHLSYEVLLASGSQQRSLPLDVSLEAAGIHSGDLVLIRTIGRTVDGYRRDAFCANALTRRGTGNTGNEDRREL